MLRKAFANGSSANIKLSKTQLSKIEHLGRYLGSIFTPFKNPDWAAKKIIENSSNIISALNK